MNPYSGATFFEFLGLFVQRLFQGSLFTENLSLDELQFFTLAAISISSCIVGCFLVLRKTCMVANSISHTILTGIVTAYLIYYYYHQGEETLSFAGILPSEWLLFLASIITAQLTVYFTNVLSSYVGVKDDASIGIVFTFLFSIGILLVTVMTKNAHIGAELIMGNADLVTQEDLKISVQVAFCNLLVVLLLYRGFFVTTFDPVFAKVIGYKSSLFGYILMTLVAITCVGAFRSVGFLLVLAYIVSPPLIARVWCSRLKIMLLISCIVGIGATFISVALSRHLFSTCGLSISTSSLTVVFLSLAFVVSAYVRKKSIIIKPTSA